MQQSSARIAVRIPQNSKQKRKRKSKHNRIHEGRPVEHVVSARHATAGEGGARGRPEEHFGRPALGALCSQDRNWT